MENPLHFDPSTQQRQKRKRHGIVKEWACGEHLREVGWLKGGQPCPRCEPVQPKRARGDVYRGWYEHIDSTPIWVDSKAQLYRECVKRGKMAQVLMSGGEMKRPRGA